MTHTWSWMRAGWRMVMHRERFWPFALLGLIYVAISSFASSFCCVPALVLDGPLTAVVFVVIFHFMRTGKVDLGQMNEGLKVFAPTLLFGLVFAALFSVVFGIGFGLSVMFVTYIQPVYMDWGALWLQFIVGMSVYFVCTIPAILIGTFYLFAVPLILDKGMGFWEAMETSRKRVEKNLLGLFGFTLVIIAIHFIGMLVCCVGVVAATVIAHCAIAAAYKELWPEETVEGEVGQAAAEGVQQ